MSDRAVALTGIKPTGRPHIGNYLGAYKPGIELTEKHRGVFFVADYHALTSEKDGGIIREDTYAVAASWIALGLDVDEHILFRQSDVSEVHELTWILSCFASMGILNKAHAFKDAVSKGKEANHGLFAYPVLMAADILLYETEVVPVGQDQKQHLEISRQIANRINETYGEGTLVVPDALIQADVGTVPGLDGQKMSKSYDNTIPVFETPKKLRKRFMKIVTGSEELDDPKDPDTCNVFALYKLFASDEEVATMAEKYRAGGYGYGHAKQDLYDKYESLIAPHREVYDRLMDDRGELDRILTVGAEKARVIAKRVIARLRKHCGFGH